MPRVFDLTFDTRITAIEEEIRDLKEELWRMEMAYDNLFIDNKLARTYSEIENIIRNRENDIANYKSRTRKKGQSY